MKCPRCSGYVVMQLEPVETMVINMGRCINCGARFEYKHIPVDYGPDHRHIRRTGFHTGGTRKGK